MAEVNWEERFKALVREVEAISQGVYPMAVAGSYEKRTERMEGWNEAVLDLIHKVHSAIERVESVQDRQAREDRDFLIATDALFVDEDRLSINLNDTFGWACSESEDVPPDKIEDVAGLYRRWGFYALVYWASRMRGGQMSQFKDINRFIEFIRREEEWREREPSSNKRAYTEIQP